MYFIITLLVSLFSVSKTDPEIYGDCFSKQEFEYFTPKFPANLSATKTFEKFLEIAIDHKMNISVILSNTEQWKNGNAKETSAILLDFPTNNANTQETELTCELGCKFLELSASEKLPLSLSTFRRDPELSVTHSNNPQAVPKTRALELLSSIRSGKQGFVFDEDEYENFAVQRTYTFLKGGKRRTRKVFYKKTKIDVLKSENVSEDELKVMKSLVSSLFLIYTEEDTPKMLVKILKQHFRQNWQVALNAGKESFFAHKKLAILELMKHKYFIYSD